MRSELSNFEREEFAAGESSSSEETTQRVPAGQGWKASTKQTAKDAEERETGAAHCAACRGIAAALRDILAREARGQKAQKAKRKAAKASGEGSRTMHLSKRLPTAPNLLQASREFRETLQQGGAAVNDADPAAASFPTVRGSLRGHPPPRFRHNHPHAREGCKLRGRENSQAVRRS